MPATAGRRCRSAHARTRYRQARCTPIPQARPKSTAPLAGDQLDRSARMRGTRRAALARDFPQTLRFSLRAAHLSLTRAPPTRSRRGLARRAAERVAHGVQERAAVLAAHAEQHEGEERTPTEIAHSTAVTASECVCAPTHSYSASETHTCSANPGRLGATRAASTTFAGDSQTPSGSTRAAVATPVHWPEAFHYHAGDPQWVDKRYRQREV